MVYYFAYGSNLDVDRIKKRMNSEEFRFRNIPKGKYKIVGPAIRKGYKLVFNKINDKPGTGYANIIEYPDSVVEGLLYEIDKDGIKRLNICEGVSSGDYYRNDNFEIETSDGKCKATVYIAVPEKTKEGLKPSQEYRQHLLAGKKFLSPEYYEFLESVETID